MIGSALRRSAIVSNSGDTISSAVVPGWPKVPCISPNSFWSSRTSRRSLTVSVWLMM